MKIIFLESISNSLTQNSHVLIVRFAIAPVLIGFEVCLITIFLGLAEMRYLQVLVLLMIPKILLFLSKNSNLNSLSKVSIYALNPHSTTSLVAS